MLYTNKTEENQVAIDLRFNARDIVIKLDPECLEWFRALPQGETKKKIERMFDTLKERPDSGDHVPRHLWPGVKSYEGINNLFRYEIDRSMRATYTIRRDGMKIVVRVIEIFPDHKSYEKRFHY